jgi:hypothetical protein
MKTQQKMYPHPSRHTSPISILLAIALLFLLAVAACTPKEPGFGGKYLIQGVVTLQDTFLDIPETPVAQAKVQLSFASNRFLYETFTDEMGRFEIFDVQMSSSDKAYLHVVANRDIQGWPVEFSAIDSLTLTSPMDKDSAIFDLVEFSLQADYPEGTVIVQTLDGQGSPQPGTTVCCYTNATLWDSLAPTCSDAYISRTTASPNGKAVFAGLYPNATYFFVAEKAGAITLHATDTITARQGVRVRQIVLQ